MAELYSVVLFLGFLAWLLGVPATIIYLLLVIPSIETIIISAMLSLSYIAGWIYIYHKAVEHAEDEMYD